MKTFDIKRHQISLGYIAALGSALSYALGTLVAREIVTEYAPPIVGVAFAMIFGTGVMAVLSFKYAFKEILFAPKQALIYMILAGLTSAWGVSFLFFALDNAPVVLVAPLAGTSPLLSVFLTHMFLQRLETVTWTTTVGACLIFIGVVLITVTSD